VNPRRIGSLSVTPIGLGTATFAKYCDERAAVQTVHAALDLGVTLFDTADSYGAGRCGRAEEILGRALRGRRDEVVIATKVGTEFDGRPASARGAWIVRAAEGSLRRLGTEYVDILLLHVPDDTVPLAETLVAMAALVKAGKVREFGCCNLSGAQLATAARVCRELSLPPLRCVQDEYSVAARSAEADILPFCVAEGAGFMAYAPLCYGLLTGKYAGGVPPGSRLDRMGPERASRLVPASATEVAQRFTDLSTRWDLPAARLALAWLLTKDVVSVVIPGATTAAQVRDNVAAHELLPLPAEIVAAVDSLAGYAVSAGL